MTQHANFLLALPADPRGDMNRLVYADWLEEQGHPLADLLRLQVEIAGRRPGDPEIADLHGREKAILRDQARRFEELLAELAGDTAVQQRAADVLALSGRDPVGFGCPTCLGTLTREFSKNHPAILHWKLNPGLAVNELVFGTRLLRDTLLCAGCGLYCVRCPACRRFPDARDLLRGFADWLGIRCPDCGAQLPLVTNFVTAGVLGVGKLAVRGLAWLAGRRGRS
jgi:uncharacterized protein (TIGR02996 family)